jgi:hypothetical protein
MFVCYGLVSTISTVLTPVVAYQGFVALFIVRLFQVVISYNMVL